jgi:aryl-alcohol dehydrogenase-like predicted oxidoreductase
MQVAYSPVDRKVEDTVIPACRALSLDIVTHSSLAQGLCSGKYGPGSTFGPGDVRSRSPYFNGAYAANMAVVARMHEVGERHGRTPAQVALGWIMGERQVASALVGIKTVEQVRENVDVLWDMTPGERRYIAEGSDPLVAVSGLYATARR